MNPLRLLMNASEKDRTGDAVRVRMVRQKRNVPLR